MLYLTQTLLFPWLLLALALGLYVGWRSCRQTPRLEGIGWLGIGLIAFVVGLIIAAILAIPGRMGLWFDTALHFLFWYLVGCCIGCLLGRSGLSQAEPAAAAASVAAAAAPLARRTEPAPAPKPAAAPAPAGPAPVRPYQWQAARDAEAVTLTGYTPSEDSRRSMVAAAKVAFSPVAVVDKLKLGGAAPQGLEAMASAAFGHLAKLDRGIASLVDQRYTLTGVAGTRPSWDGAMAAVKALPPGFTLAKVDIVAPPAPASVPAAAPEPAAAPAIAGEEAIAGKRPPGLAAPRGGQADDLKRIRGIGRQNEGRLHGLGIWHFDQVAAWTAEQALWVGSYLAFPGRIEREEWVSQAKSLAAGAETEFSKRVAKGQVSTSRDDGSLGKGNVESVKPLRESKGAPPPRKPVK